MRYFLSLGSNLGQRRRYLTKAIEHLKAAGVRILKASSIYKTQPVGLADQPWFYNQVLEVATDLNPYELLALAKEIERKLRRQKTVVNGPRTIDIDLLLAEKSIIQTRNLVIPHPRLHQRRFVLEPLSEIAAETLHPLKRKKIETLLKETEDNSAVIRLKANPRNKPAKKGGVRGKEKVDVG